MVHAERTEQRREVRTEVILDRAMVLLAEEGLEKLTLGRLATSLGYVPAALYRYFDSKDALLAAMQRRAVGELHEAFRRDQLAMPAGTLALDLLLAGARTYLSFPATHPHAWHLAALLLGDPRPLLSDDESRKTAPHLLAFLGEVQGLIVRAQQAGELGPGNAVERTLALWASLHGAASLEKIRRIAPEMPSALEVGTASVRALLSGWGASAERLEGVARRVEDDDAKTKGSRRGTKRGAVA